MIRQSDDSNDHRCEPSGYFQFAHRQKLADLSRLRQAATASLDDLEDWIGWRQRFAGESTAPAQFGSLLDCVSA